MAKRKRRTRHNKNNSVKLNRHNSTIPLTAEEAWALTFVIIVYIIGMFFLLK